MEKIDFQGEIKAVKARIRLLRSFDQIPTHQYQGYVLVINGKVGPEEKEFRVAVGPKAHEKHQFCIRDQLSGKALPVENKKQEWAEFYKVSGLELMKRSPENEKRPPDPDGGIAPPLEVYRENGHFRLDTRTCNSQCILCPWGLTMATEMIIDHWNPSHVKWRFETHCYGPRDCPRYKAGKPYRVPGRKGMFYVDDDVERAELEGF